MRRAGGLLSAAPHRGTLSHTGEHRPFRTKEGWTAQGVVSDSAEERCGWVGGGRVSDRSDGNTPSTPSTPTQRTVLYCTVQTHTPHTTHPTYPHTPKRALPQPPGSSLSPGPGDSWRRRLLSYCNVSLYSYYRVVLAAIIDIFYYRRRLSRDTAVTLRCTPIS